MSKEISIMPAIRQSATEASASVSLRFDKLNEQADISLSIEDGEGQTAESGQGEALRGVELMK